VGLAVKQGGLAERRAMKAFEDTDFPALVKEIQAAAGYDVTSMQSLRAWCQSRKKGFDMLIGYLAKTTEERTLRKALG